MVLAQAKSSQASSFPADESVFLAAHRDDAPSVASGACAWRLQVSFFSSNRVLNTGVRTCRCIVLQPSWLPFSR